MSQRVRVLSVFSSLLRGASAPSGFAVASLPKSGRPACRRLLLCLGWGRCVLHCWLHLSSVPLQLGLTSRAPLPGKIVSLAKKSLRDKGINLALNGFTSFW
ncbi:hypothetical protein NDU88_004959 [Pleurodeles waltl]|uniref:Secreted protein n=1 Tax=Pleurodeles waltl TaxID=8319 RepID=A0AAV7L638_PLEWA|nr:hypothetical protein NDU88_004959 [Pleurodeles waltl]